jgi:hypothetical protein
LWNGDRNEEEVQRNRSSHASSEAWTSSQLPHMDHDAECRAITAITALFWQNRGLELGLLDGLDGGDRAAFVEHGGRTMRVPEYREDVVIGATTY